METNYFNELNKIDVNDKTEQKNGLTYLSWAWAWAEVKKRFPDANYVVYENTLPNGYTINYFTDGKTGYVKTGVIINNIEHIEYLPIMDFRNKSIPFESITSFDVNKAIQRSLTKAVARHGLGLYIYAGEDLPEEADKPISKADRYADLELINRAKEVGVNLDKVCEFYKVKIPADLKYAQLESSINAKLRSAK